VPVSERREGRRLVIAPQEPLLGGGPAEEFERRVQAVFRDGFRHIIADLRSVPAIDSAGIRALVRGHTTAQRLQGTFRIVQPTSGVQSVLRLGRLDSVLATYDSVEEARATGLPWAGVALAAAAIALCAVLVAAGQAWPDGAEAASPPLGPPLLQLAKLIAAALIGMVITSVHRYNRADTPQSHTMDQAQVLLCVSGAMMMVIIGNNLARAFGIAGAASIVRFRTPVDDPKDITILFLLMGLGMAAGLGAFAVAGLGMLFLCVCLATLPRFGGRRQRTMLVEVVAEGREFPTAHVQRILASNQVVFEPREVSQGSSAAIQYQATISPGTSIEDVSAQLIGGGATGVKSVSWEPAKRTI
jgi:anti-anti-sigma factor